MENTIVQLQDIADISYSMPLVNNSDRWYPVLTVQDLISEKFVFDVELTNKYEIDSKYKLQENDILIKRIAPQFVNIITNIPNELYSGNNLFIVRADKQKINSEYLAYILNEQILKLSQKDFSSRISSINIKDLRTINIPLLSLNKQQAIGRLWILNINKRKLKQELSTLEFKKEKLLLTHYIYGG